MESKFIELALKSGTKVNREPVWGNYREALLSKSIMLKIIRFYKGGITSIHKHPTDELVFMELGEVHVRSGENPKKLKRRVFGPGGLIYVPAGTWHSTGCSRTISNELPFALGVEFQIGKIKGGKYKIDRFKPAKKTVIKLD